MKSESTSGLEALSNAATAWRARRSLRRPGLQRLQQRRVSRLAAGPQGHVDTEHASKVSPGQNPTHESKCWGCFQKPGVQPFAAGRRYGRHWSVAVAVMSLGNPSGCSAP